MRTVCSIAVGAGGAVERRAWRCALLTCWLAALAGGCDRAPAPPQAATALAASQQPDLADFKRVLNPLAMTFQASDKPAPKPRTPLPTGASCVTSECHASFGSATRLHAPLHDKSCDACHGSDRGDHTFPLLRTGNDMCTVCHDTVGAKANQHAAIATDGCITCHDPHAGEQRGLIKSHTEAALCATCHDIPLRRNAHTPFAEGHCSVCHDPHESDTRALLRGGDGSAQCLRCHDEIGRRLELSTQGPHAKVIQSCTTCHNPHTTDFPKLLTTNVQDNCVACHEATGRSIADADVSHGAATDAMSCGNCHNAHGSPFDHLLADREDRVCLSCHNKVITTATGRRLPDMRVELSQKFPHGQIAAGGCSGCHDSHGAASANLLREPFSPLFYAADTEAFSLCFQCHSRELLEPAHASRVTEFRSGEVNLHAAHATRGATSRSCKACHAVHASPHPAHIADAIAFEGSDWSMPMRFKKLPTGGSCAPGCHQPMSYDRSAPPNAAALLPREELP